MIHTCLVSYNRLHLTQRAIRSYLDTVNVPFSLVVVDNGSTDGTQDWLWESKEALIGVFDVLLLGENRYPGYACNRGWEQAPPGAVILHRADNDFVFLPGWCDELMLRFLRRQVGQVGLRTDDEELHAPVNVGGNNAIRRTLWDKGLRYDERRWGDYPPGFTEDSILSPAVEAMGYEWTRVLRPCIQPISVEEPDDPYYQETWAARGIKRP